MTANCAHHPERVADAGTCTRCGTFVCAECAVAATSPALCAECLKRLESGPHVRHAKALGVLMMIHGGLLAAMGAYYVLFGGFMLDALADIPADPADPTAAVLPEIMVVTFAFIGVTHILPGGLQLLGGWRLFRFEGVGLGWAGALVGLISLCGIYCGPSAVALAGYAIWVLTRDDVQARFAVGPVTATSSR